MNRWMRAILITWVLSVWFMFVVAFEAIVEGPLHWAEIVFMGITTLLLLAISETNKKEGG